MKPTQELTRYEYKTIADVIMNYCVEELGMDKMAALPFVSNLTTRLTPTLLRLFTAQTTREGKDSV